MFTRMYKAAGTELNKALLSEVLVHLAIAQQFELFGWFFKYAILLG